MKISNLMAKHNDSVFAKLLQVYFYYPQRCANFTESVHQRSNMRRM